MEELKTPEGGTLIPVPIDAEVKKAYIDYSMSVIVSRALPDVRDGLKPVHRRILYSMEEKGLRFNGPTRKCAKIVGDVLGSYHPHGDASVYDALVRLGQDFSLRYPVITPQGNFGTIAGDPPAAYRYTEAKMARLAEAMVEDIKKETVDFVPNFDESTEEPSVLPAKFPFLLANGSSGIAVGMATNMPPHNLREIAAAVAAYIDQPDISVDEAVRSSEVMLPSMLIQVPVENALKHALRDKEGERLLWIKVLPWKNGGIRVTITDNGGGFRPQSSNRGTGTGMRVIMQTIQILNQQNKEPIDAEVHNVMLPDGCIGCEVSFHIPAAYDYHM